MISQLYDCYWCLISCLWYLIMISHYIPLIWRVSTSSMPHFCHSFSPEQPAGMPRHSASPSSSWHPRPPSRAKWDRMVWTCPPWRSPEGWRFAGGFAAWNWKKKLEKRLNNEQWWIFSMFEISWFMWIKTPGLKFGSLVRENALFDVIFMSRKLELGVYLHMAIKLTVKYGEFFRSQLIRCFWNRRILIHLLHSGARNGASKMGPISLILGHSQ